MLQILTGACLRGRERVEIAGNTGLDIFVPNQRSTCCNKSIPLYYNHSLGNVVETTRRRLFAKFLSYPSYNWHENVESWICVVWAAAVLGSTLGKGMLARAQNSRNSRNFHTALRVYKPDHLHINLLYCVTL